MNIVNEIAFLLCIQKRGCSKKGNQHPDSDSERIFFHRFSVYHIAEPVMAAGTAYSIMEAVRERIMESRKELVDQYRKWILHHQSDRYIVSENAKGTIELQTENYVASVFFYPEEIIELRIESIREGKTEFFLHFQMTEISHARTLFEELEKTLLTLDEAHPLKILLCCTSGLTTSYFASELNKAAQAMNIKMTFRAKPIRDVYENGFGYDAVLLAPQVSYERERLQNALSGATVMNIPPQIFARYDCGNLIDLVRNELWEEKNERTPNSERTLRFFETKEKILCVAVINSKGTIHIEYRYYDRGEVTVSGVSEQNGLDFNELEDVIRKFLENHPETTAIGLSVPGMVENDTIKMQSRVIKGDDIIRRLKKRFDRRIYAFNDVNMISTGIYWLEDRYRTIVTYFLPEHASVGGAGIVVNGHLVRGEHSIAGEASYLVKLLKLSAPADELCRSQEGLYELLAKSVIPMIVTVGPEAVYIVSNDLKDIRGLKEKMEEYIPEKLMPELIHLQSMENYMMVGLFLRCIWAINTENFHKNGFLNDNVLPENKYR